MTLSPVSAAFDRFAKEPSLLGFKHGMLSQLEQSKLDLPAKALVTACLSMRIDKNAALEVIEDEFDHPTDLVPLDSPAAAVS